MIHKLTTITRRILIGLSVILLFTLESCWQKNYDYTYTVQFKNTTQETILLELAYDNTEYGDIFLIFPNDSTLYDNFGLNEEIDFVHTKLFDHEMNPIKDNCALFRNDSLKKVWYPPAKDMGETHHFYNYNSWVVEDTGDGFYTVTFNILNTDLETE